MSVSSNIVGSCRERRNKLSSLWCVRETSFLELLPLPLVQKNVLIFFPDEALLARAGMTIELDRIADRVSRLIDCYASLMHRGDFL